MFNIPEGLKSEFKKIYETHQVSMSACEVFFQNIRMLNGRHTLMDRDTFAKHYLGFTSDIELVTPPTEAFIPTDGTVENCIFVVDRNSAEYVRIANRVTVDELFKTFDKPTDPIHIALKDNQAESLLTIHDDIFIYYCLFKYIDQIDQITYNTLINGKPIVEYIMNAYTVNDFKSFLATRRINDEKLAKHFYDFTFDITYAKISGHFVDNDKEELKIDVDDLFGRLITNIVLKSDIYIILGIYLIMQFYVSSSIDNCKEEDDVVKYVKEIISKI